MKCKIYQSVSFYGLLLTAGMLLTGCSKDSGDSAQQAKQEPQEIRVQTNVTNVLEGRRAQTYSVVDDLQTEAHFTCTAYNAGTLTPYISTTTVDWNGEASQWQFNNGDSHYYWPLPASNGGAWPSLDFFGYMPATRPSYIAADPTYDTSTHNVTFTCTGLPMTYSSATPTTGQGSNLKEFMFGMALNQNYGNAAAGVPLTFQHPFARIKLQLAASHPDITINSITFRSIQNNGSYDHSATPKWSTSGGDANFVLTLTGAAATFDNNTTAKPIGPDFIMIPQDWTGEIVVNADCLFWGEKKNYPSLTTTIPTNWQPGYSYTYTFTINPDDLKVNIAKFTEQW